MPDAQTLQARRATVSAFGGLVDAMRGIAATRAEKARRAIAGVEAYAGTVAAAIVQAQRLQAAPSQADASGRGAPLRLVFCPEQGFDGGLTERVIEALPRPDAGRVLLVGSHGARAARARGIAVEWTGPAIAHADAAVTAADELHVELARALARRPAPTVELVHARLLASMQADVVCRRLLPLEVAPGRATAEPPPLIHLAPARLLDDLAIEYVAAQLASALLQSHAAENATRLQAMTAAHDNVARMMETLAADESRLRQESITAEIVELAAGLAALRGKTARTPP